MGTTLVEDIPTFEINDRFVKWTWGGGKSKCMPLPQFRLCTARQVELLAEYDAREAEVVPIRGRKR